MTPVNIDLRIDELVLHGFAPGDRHVIGEAVERELSHLFAEQGATLPDSHVEIPALDAGTFRIASGSNADVVGAQLARTVYRGLMR